MKLSANKLGVLVLSYFISANCYSADYYDVPISDIPPPNISCVMTNSLASDGTAAYSQYRFMVKTPVIYYVCTSDNIRYGQILKAVWTAVDTRNIWPNDKTLWTELSKARTNGALNKPWVFSFRLAMPAKGWPVGDYQVDLYYNNDLIIDSQTFSVTFNTNAW